MKEENMSETNKAKDLKDYGKMRDYFETDNLIIRRFRENDGDTEDLRQYAAYKMSTGFEAWEQWPTEFEAVKAMMPGWATTEHGWAVERKEDSRVIGWISFNKIENRYVDMGHGFTQPLSKSNDEKAEALRVMIQYAFDLLDIDAVAAMNEKAWVDNTAPLFLLGFSEIKQHDADDPRNVENIIGAIHMELDIKKLSPELANDYIDFFDKYAFCDGSEFAGCYCTWYHWNDDYENERKKCNSKEKL